MRVVLRTDVVGEEIEMSMVVQFGCGPKSTTSVRGAKTSGSGPSAATLSFEILNFFPSTPLLQHSSTTHIYTVRNFYFIAHTTTKMR